MNPAVLSHAPTFGNTGLNFNEWAKAFLAETPIAEANEFETHQNNESEL